MAKRKKINLSNLQLNTENYRFEPAESQEEAIEKIIENQGNNKLLNLTKDIIENWLNPHDDIIVYPSSHNKTKYNILEGNRRITVIKLLKNPELINGQKYSLLKRQFKKLHEGFKAKIKTKIDCFVYDDPKEAEHWIGVKHGYGIGGVGTENWDPIQRYRFEEKTQGKSALLLQIIKRMKNSPHVSEDIKNKLKDLKVTNLGRLISDPQVRDFLGIFVEDGNIKSEIEEKEVMRCLSQIIKDLSEQSFNVKKIYTKVEREDYLKSFPKTSRPNKKNKKRIWQFKGKPYTTKSRTSKPRPNPKDREKLIPRECVLIINNKYPKINRIYHELLDLNINEFTNAVAVLFRVFIELSLDAYIEKNKIRTTKLNRDSILRKKINGAINDLEKKGIEKYFFKGIKTAVNTENDLLSTDTWNAYLHNDKFSPSVKHLITTWDNIQPFIEKVWENIK